MKNSLSNLLNKDRTQREDKQLRDYLNRLEATIDSLGTAISQGGRVKRLTAGSVILSDGLTVLNGPTETIRLEMDGDAFFGSDLSAAATTSLIVFSNDQTYNSESMGEADVLLGDNSASKANVLWDKSAGQLKFRGGTTVQGYIDTDGTAVFGAGDVEINSSGIYLQTGTGNANTLKWEDLSSSKQFGAIVVATTGSSPNRSAQMTIDVYAEGTGDGQLIARAADDAGDQYGIFCDGATGRTEIKHWLSQSGSSISNLAAVVHKSHSGTHPAAGFGAGLVYYLDNASSSAILAAKLTTAWTTATAGSEASEVVLRNRNAGTTAAGFTYNATEFIINNDSVDLDFRVESDGNTHALFVDGGNNTVGILNSSPGEALDVTGNIAVSGTVDGVDVAALDSAAVKHALADAANDFLVASGADTFVKKTLAETGAILEGDISHDNLVDFVANEHVDHSGVTLTAGAGLTGGGDITANRTFALSHLGIESLSDPGGDQVLFWDDTNNITKFGNASSGLTITNNGINIAVTVDATAVVMHSLADAANDFLVASGANTFVKKTLAETGAILEGDIDHGNLQGLDTGADHSYINQDVTTTASPTFAGADLDGAVTINDSSADVDFRVESNGNQNMIRVDAGNNRVGIGVAPSVSFHAQGVQPWIANFDGDTGSVAFVMQYRNLNTASSSNYIDWRFLFYDSTPTLQDFAALQIDVVDHTSGSEDARFNFKTVAAGSANTNRWHIGLGFYAATATGGDKGAGTINTSGDIYKNNSAYTNPDYVLEHYFTGQVIEFADRPGADVYQGLPDLGEVESYMRLNHRLPLISDMPMGAFERSDVALLHLEQLYLHVIELEKRVKELENVQ